jgi:hypothetical protein
VRNGIRACAYLAPGWPCVRQESPPLSPPPLSPPPLSSVPAAQALPAAPWDVIPAAQALPTSLFLLRRQPPLGRGSKVNGSSDFGDLAPVTVPWGLMAFTADTLVPAKRQNRGDNQNGHRGDAYDERCAHKQRLRRFARVACREKRAPARRGRTWPGPPPRPD